MDVGHAQCDQPHGSVPQILAALEASSSTFASKTEFSQEKYRRKKARKYLAYATVIRPTARSICEVLSRL
jgi:hypothetical protein